MTVESILWPHRLAHRIGRRVDPPQDPGWIEGLALRIRLDVVERKSREEIETALRERLGLEETT